MKCSWLVRLAAALSVAVTAGCAVDPPGPDPAGRLRVVASFYPIEFLARSVGGERVHVTGLTPPGVEAHDLELTAKQLSMLERADLVLYFGQGFQPSVQKLIEQLPGRVVTVDLLASVEQLSADEGERDPHVWLDPQRMATMAQAVADHVNVVAQDHVADATLIERDLNALDQELAVGLSRCAARTLVTGHRAFAYLADRYQLRQLSIAGISPDHEPTPKALASVTSSVKANGVTTIFFEEQLPKRLAETIAREVGAATAALDPIEGLDKVAARDGVDYLALQRQNLQTLRAGLQCS